MRIALRMNLILIHQVGLELLMLVDSGDCDPSLVGFKDVILRSLCLEV